MIWIRYADGTTDFLDLVTYAALPLAKVCGSRVRMLKTRKE